MKTKTFFLLCLLSGIGLTQLNAQSNDKNINRSYAYWREFPMGGYFPVSCEGTAPGNRFRGLLLYYHGKG